MDNDNFTPDGFTEKAEEVRSEIENGLEKVSESFENTAENLAEKAEEVASGVEDEFETISETVENAAENAAAEAEEAVDELAGNLKDAAEDAGDFLSGAVDDFAEKAEEAAEAADEAREEIGETILEEAAEIRDEVSDAADKFASAAKDAADDFEEGFFEEVPDGPVKDLNESVFYTPDTQPEDVLQDVKTINSHKPSIPQYVPKNYTRDIPEMTEDRLVRGSMNDYSGIPPVDDVEPAPRGAVNSGNQSSNKTILWIVIAVLVFLCIIGCCLAQAFFGMLKFLGG